MGHSEGVVEYCGGSVLGLMLFKLCITDLELGVSSKEAKLQMKLSCSGWLEPGRTVKSSGGICQGWVSGHQWGCGSMCQLSFFHTLILKSFMVSNSTLE